MKLSQYAKKVGVTYRTAFRWFQEGKLPENVKASQTPSGTIIIEELAPLNSEQLVYIYCRVSSYEKKDDLERQVKRCESYCISRGYQISKVYKEIASGMNDNRPQLKKMLSTIPTILVVENKDRLTRFGFNYLYLLLNKLNCKVEVINVEDGNEKDLMKDLISIITSFCCRLYGMRRGYNKAKNITNQIENSSL
jgi:predicted site-specific integrase-resolvase